MKAFVPLEIEAYAIANSTPESDICRLIREETSREMDDSEMLSGPLVCAFLKLMVEIVQAKRILEVGMYTGYSALSMAEVLPMDGMLITCEIDPVSIAVAKKHFEMSPHGLKIEVREEPALDTLSSLEGPFDLIFIDADKANYLEYYKKARERLDQNGVILIDNVLWSGRVLESPSSDPATQAIQMLNQTVASDPEMIAVLLTLRDGLLLIRRR